MTDFALDSVFASEVLEFGDEAIDRCAASDGLDAGDYALAAWAGTDSDVTPSSSR
jgi:hypothetical protein